MLNHLVFERVGHNNAFFRFVNPKYEIFRRAIGFVLQHFRKQAKGFQQVCFKLRNAFFSPFAPAGF